MNIQNYQLLIDFESEIRFIRNDQKCKIMKENKKLNIMIDNKTEYKEDD